MPEWIGTMLLLAVTGLSAVVIEEKIVPLPKWTGPIFLYIVMPALYLVYVAAIVIAWGYLR